MAGCSTFVSLLRSCYQTKARFFHDRPDIIHDVFWNFTAPDAKWCGQSNILNARTWYDGEVGWPEVGEIEGAARKWRSGKVHCLGHLAAQGDSDQWERGAYFVDALTVDPCSAPEDSPFPDYGCSAFFEDRIDLALFWTPDLAYIQTPYVALGQDGVYRNYWLACFRQPTAQGACCFPSIGRWALTNGPPGFARYFVWTIAGVTLGCTGIILESAPPFGPSFFARVDNVPPP